MVKVMFPFIVDLLLFGCKNNINPLFRMIEDDPASNSFTYWFLSFKKPTNFIYFAAYIQ